MPNARALLAAAVFVTAAALPCTAAVEGPQEPVRFLDVPYLSQTEALCGGAAAAMVMRYWGAGAVYADTFAHLVDRKAGGIRGADLIRTLREQGWQAASFKGDAALVAHHLDSRRPVIALIEDRPGRFHYVVLVGWSGDRVVAHDPARAPFRVYDAPVFIEAWSKSGFWTLMATPEAGVPDGAADAGWTSAPAVSPEAGTCGPMVTEGIRLAGVGELDQARRLLELAAEACPRAAGPRRELAGVHALQREWGSAAWHAREAIALDPKDAHAARILGTSLFLEDDLDDALDAWNLIGEPTIDLVNVTGLQRTRYEVVADLLRTHPRELLTAARVGQARRRLAELPSAAFSRVSYAPTASGRANLEAMVLERPLAPWGLVPLGVIAARSLTDGELSATLSSPSGGGETFSASWRWWARRPRVAISFSTPSPVRRAGSVWRLDAFYDRQTYHTPEELEEARRGGRFAIADWLTDRWRWELAVGLDRWTGRQLSAELGSSLRWHSRSDLGTVAVGGSLHAGGVASGTFSVNADWRSAARHDGRVWHARTGLSTVGSSAPLGLWFGAGTGHARDPLLRAHPILADGVVRAGVFGRTLTHGGIELRHWVRPATRGWRIAPALFLDAARAARTGPAFDTRLHFDAGLGVRLGIPGGGTLRIDAGRGLRDGAMAVSAGWSR